MHVLTFCSQLHCSDSVQVVVVTTDSAIHIHHLYRQLPHPEHFYLSSLLNTVVLDDFSDSQVLGLIGTFCSACVSFPSLLTHLRPLGHLAISVLSLKGKFGFLRLLRPILTFLLTFLAIFRSVPMLHVFVCMVNLSACFLSRLLRLYHVLESIGEFDDFWFFEVMLASSQPFLHQFDRSACA